MSLHLERQIDKVKRLILTLGARVQVAVDNAIKSVHGLDKVLAMRVIERDVKIDELEVEVEEECLHTLALFQPVAMDLRFIVSVLKMNNDLERIADLAVNIAEQVCFLADEPQLERIPYNQDEMVAGVRKMLSQAMNALVAIDSETADLVRATDDKIDVIHRRMYDQIIAEIKNRPDQTSQLIHLMSISKSLERIGDLAVNIAEDVIYMVRGDILRHTAEPVEPHGA